MNCPICNNSMMEITVAPCYDCGHEKNEIEKLKKRNRAPKKKKKLEYYKYEIFGQEIVLCEFCYYDFDSYDPFYLGLQEDIPLHTFKHRLEIIENPKEEKDYYCEKCQKRLKFLNFLKNARKNNNT